MNMSLTGRILEARRRIGEAARRAGRDPSAVTLLAATKTVPPGRIREAWEAGLRDFGENRVQEALAKMPILPPEARWHLLGPIQKNKIPKVLGRFVLLQAVDSTTAAETLSRRVSGQAERVLLEVNVSGEASKAGVAPGEALAAARTVASLPGLCLKGFMALGPHTEDAAKVRDAFRRMRDLFEAVRREGFAPEWDTLSLGMSGDFEIAVEEGSTLVRLGTFLFGERGL